MSHDDLKKMMEKSGGGKPAPASIFGPPDYDPAGLFARLLAMIIDGMVVFGIYMLIPMSVIQMVLSLATNNIPWAGGVIYIVLWIIPSIYYVGMESSPWQATLGKRMLGIYIMREDGDKASILLLLGRSFVLSATIALSDIMKENDNHIVGTVYWFAVFLIIPLIKNKRMVHDLLCGTVVAKGKL